MEKRHATAASSRSYNTSKTETLAVFGVIAIWFVFNLVTARFYPPIWVDEINYSDPAINLRLGHGFTSSTWYAQSAHEFWAGNVPLHEVLLYLWICLFGDSITALRSINFLYGAVACLLLWRGVIRLDLIPRAGLRLLLIGLLLGGYAMVFTYRCGRPDCLAMLLLAASFYVYALPKTWIRLIAIFFIGLAIPWSALQVAPTLLFGGILLILFLGRRVTREIGALWSGNLIGGIALIVFYKSLGVLDGFVASILPHMTLTMGESISYSVFASGVQSPRDLSLIPLLLTAVFVALVAAGKRQIQWRSPLLFGILYTSTVSVALLLKSKFPTYYCWMIYVPLAVCVCAALSQQHLGQRARWIGTLVAIAAIPISLFAHGEKVLRNWSKLDYGQVVMFINENVRPDDVMYGEWITYYAAKKQAHEFFSPDYLTIMTDTEKRRLSVLVIQAKRIDKTLEKVGGSWNPTGAKPYCVRDDECLHVFRRSDTARR